MCRIVSKKLIIQYFSFLRQLVIGDIEKGREIIGGEGFKVKTDKSKFTKRKCNCGNQVGDELWVYGGIEIDTQEN